MIYYRLFQVIEEGEEYSFFEIRAFNDYDTALEQFNLSIMAYPHDIILLAGYMGIASAKMMIWITDIHPKECEHTGELLLRLYRPPHFHPTWQTEWS